MATNFGTISLQEFGATSTTEDVLSGINLRGKRILLPAYPPGSELKRRVLAAHGAHVVGAARDLGES